MDIDLYPRIRDIIAILIAFPPNQEIISFYVNSWRQIHIIVAKWLGWAPSGLKNGFASALRRITNPAALTSALIHIKDWLAIKAQRIINAQS